MAIFNEKGQQIPDPTPIEVPLNFKRPLSIQEEIKRFVRSEFSQRAADQGHETFEEADDFVVEDELGEFVSPYEFTEMQEEARFSDGSDLTQPEPPVEPRAQPGEAHPRGAPAAPSTGAAPPVPPVDDRTLPLPGVPAPSGTKGAGK